MIRRLQLQPGRFQLERQLLPCRQLELTSAYSCFHSESNLDESSGGKLNINYSEFFIISNLQENKDIFCEIWGLHFPQFWGALSLLEGTCFSEQSSDHWSWKWSPHWAVYGPQGLHPTSHVQMAAENGPRGSATTSRKLYNHDQSM